MMLYAVNIAGKNITEHERTRRLDDIYLLAPLYSVQLPDGYTHVAFSLAESGSDAINKVMAVLPSDVEICQLKVKLAVQEDYVISVPGRKPTFISQVTPYIVEIQNDVGTVLQVLISPSRLQPLANVVQRYSEFLEEA